MEAPKALIAMEALIVKEIKAQTIAESQILSACQEIVKTMLVDEAEKEIKKIPLSDDMSNDMYMKQTS